MRTNRDRNWDLIGDMLAAESSGKSPRLFASRKTLFGIPSALDEELTALSENSTTTVDPSAMLGESSARNTPSATTAGSSLSRVPSAKRSDRVVHPLRPVYDKHSKVLILGTMPSPKSRETGFY